jgi:hypothetical protein
MQFAKELDPGSEI